MTRKTLGRCARRHAQVVEYQDGEMPAGTCKSCGDMPLIEWAVKTTPAKESGR